MALPQKGLRKIFCNEKLFGWLIRKKPTYCQGALASPITLSIQLLECERPKVLNVILNYPRPDNWLNEMSCSVTPEIIEKIIIEATISGWQPDSGGSAFLFEYDI